MKENSYLAHKINETQLREQQLVVEYNSLRSYCPSGIYVLPQLGNLNVWQGVIFLRQGPFKNATFRFKIEIPQDYPNTIPGVYFYDFIYHPLIDPNTGELALGPQFPVWRPGKDFIFSLLGYVKKVFYSTEMWTVAEYVLNAKALETFTQDEMVFYEEARRCVINSGDCEENFKNEALRFKKFNAFHHVILKNLKENIEKPSEFLNYFRRNFIYIGS